MDQISIQFQDDKVLSTPEKGMNSVLYGTWAIPRISSEEDLKKHLEKREQLRGMTNKVAPLRFPVRSKEPESYQNLNERHPHEPGDILRKATREIEAIREVYQISKKLIQALEERVSMQTFSTHVLSDKLKKCEDERDFLRDDLKVKDIELTPIRRKLESLTKVKQKMIVDNMQFISNLESKSKKATSCMATLQARVGTLEDQLKAASEATKYQDWAFKAIEDDLKEEQNKVQDLEKEVEDSKTRAIKIATALETQLHAIQEENKEMKKTNQSLLVKTSAERRRLEEIIATLKSVAQAKDDGIEEIRKRIRNLNLKLFQIPQEPKMEPIGEREKSEGTQTLEKADSVTNFRSKVQDKAPKKSWAQPLRKFFGLKSGGRILPWKK